MLRRFLSAFISMLCLVSVTSGQERLPSSYSIKTDSLFFAENGKLAALTLVIQNESSTAFTGKLDIGSIDGITLIGKENITIQLDAHAQIYYPIRLSIGKNVPAGERPIILQLLGQDASIKAAFRSKLVVQSKKEVRLIPNRPTELMQNIGDSLSVSALLSNMGNSIERITLTASFPSSSGRAHLENKVVLLNAFQDTIITFKKIITKELLSVEHYTVNMAALYENGELINNVMVTVQNVSGNRTYRDPSQDYGFGSYNNNKITLGGRNLFSDNEAWQLSGRGVFQLQEGVLDFSIDGYRYTHTNNRPLLTNTYLNYQLNNRGITLGNIAESLETFVNGRGIKLYAGNQEESKRVEVGVVDKSYNLLGDEYSLPGGNGYTVYGKAYLNNQSNQRYTGSVLYDRTPYNDSESIIMMNDYHYQLKENIGLGFELGGGLTRVVKEPTSSFKPSIAIGNRLNGVFGKYHVSSHQFYSSGYYPGTRRGVLQVNERLTRNFNKATTWLAYSYYNYDPKYLQNELSRYTSNTSSSWMEAGTFFSLGRQASFSLSAKHQTDKGTIAFYESSTSPMITMRAFRLTESINWRSENAEHTVYLSAENGYASLPFSDKKELQVRTSATWSYRFLTLSSYFQQGDFSVIEAYSNALRGGKDRYRFNLSSSFRKVFFNAKLTTQAEVNYSRDGYSGANWMFSGFVNYAISPLFSAFVNIYVYTYNHVNFNTSYSNIQSGVSYNLPNGKKGESKKTGNVKLFLFFDNNANGVFDEGDQPAENRIVMIGSVSFITQADGTLVYKKLPYGPYALSISSENWYADVPAQIHLESHEFKLSIPLKKTSKITGKFHYNYNQQRSEEVFEKYGGLGVLVSNAMGFSAMALSNANGEFTLFVPVGTYEFKVDETTLPNQVYTNFSAQQVDVVAGKSTLIPEIELRVMERKIEIKRFSSE